jgi:hypothetical protein
MQPNYAALKAAMATGGQYAGMTDAAVLSAVNAATVTQAVDIPISAITEALALNGLLPTVKGWATSPPAVSSSVTQAASTAAATFGFIVGPPPLFDSLQMSVPATAQAINSMVSALVSAGLLTSTFANSITALGTRNVSQASLWGFQNGVYENDLAAARAMP